ncbi:dicarboxylate/amino acid:cation symporter [Lachnospiraceae bacterium C1.1]|nr:dicarboxylate/amino acid:cation symporter [Lachnospiraceae bacterium C1.1]
MKSYICGSNQKEIPKAMDYIKECLEQKKIDKKKRIRPLLVAEEILDELCRNAEEGSRIRIDVVGIMGSIEIRYSCKGKEFYVSDIEEKLLFEKSNSDNDEANAAIRGLIDRLFSNTLGIRNDKGVNHVNQIVVKSSYATLIYTLSALALGVITGLLIQSFLPAAAGKAISGYVFTPIYTVFINALKMIVAPLVFFSIAASISEFSDMKALGRLAGRVIILYVITSVIAICVGTLTYTIFPIGNPELVSAVDAEAASATIAKGESVTVSIKDTLVGIVPSDVITPFQKSDMLQIIFMAVLLGTSAAALAIKVPLLRDIIRALDKAFSKITGGIVTFIPLIVFCSMAKMMISMNLTSLKDVIVWIPVVYFGDALMICVYLLILLIVGRLNPIRFLGNYYPAMLSGFTLASSNAALPSSIKQCERMGISEKVYAFSLPLGATINMDGSCITLIITALYFARIYGLPVTANMLLSLFISIIVLSMGSPGVPGGNLVCLTLLVPQIGVPAEAISLIMGLYPVIGMMQTMANVTGDAVVTAVTANNVGMLDKEKYNK